MRIFRESYIRAPANAHPLIRALFEEMLRQRIGIADLGDKAGVGSNTISSWRTKHNPNILEIEACFNALGLELTVKRTKR